jgi:hypothetical protein
MRAATPMILEGYHALLSVWAHGALGPRGTARDQALTYLKEGLRRLRRLTSIFVMTRPRALLWEGRWRMLHGHPDAARSRFEASLAGAAELGMPYDAGLAHLWLGRALLESRSASGLAGWKVVRTHLAAAAAVFRALGAPHELGQAEALLASF